MKTSAFVSLGVAVLLVSCVGTTPSGSVLPPETVLQHATERSRDLLSSRFTADAEFETQNIPPFLFSGTLHLEGVLQDGGRTVQLALVLDALSKPRSNRDQPVRLTAKSDFLFADQREIYLHPTLLTFEPEQSYAPRGIVDIFLGKWWILPSTSSRPTPTIGGPITPTPGLLRAQSQVVRVTNDEGIVSISGRKAYHYQVSVDREKLLIFLEEAARAQNQSFDREQAVESLAKLSAQGEMWIDAENFDLLRVAWVVDSLGEGGKPVLNTSFTITFTDHNAAPTVSPPQDAQPFPLSMLGLSSLQSSFGDSSAALLP